MAVTSQEFLDFAKGAIADENCSEFALRNSCSRAYYAVYHAAKDRADHLSFPNVQVAHGGDHAKLFARYSAYSHRAKVVATKLKTLKRKRELCDYKLDEVIDYAYTSLMVEAAGRLIEDISDVQ
jgi:uncharacterized protein (UPF0332 family)